MSNMDEGARPEGEEIDFARLDFEASNPSAETPPAPDGGAGEDKATPPDEG